MRRLRLIVIRQLKFKIPELALTRPVKSWMPPTCIEQERQIQLSSLSLELLTVLPPLILPSHLRIQTLDNMGSSILWLRTKSQHATQTNLRWAQ